MAIGTVKAACIKGLNPLAMFLNQGENKNSNQK